MRRTKLWNKYCKSKSSEDLDAYRGQRNLITKMNKKAKYDHFNRKIQAKLFGNCANLSFQTLVLLKLSLV